MKQIKIKFVGFWEGFNPEEFFLTHLLRKSYDVRICEDPDYIICSVFNFYQYLGYDQIRIMFSGENYIPDFNYVDYAISTYPLELLDRHFSFPGLVTPNFDFLLELSQKDRNYQRSILNKKTCFANLITGHESENSLRGELLNLLSRYKRVESAGTYLNNMPDGKAVNMRDGSKTVLQKKCKFTICPESTQHEGFITEKIFDAFLADTIPIYCGSTTISGIINKKAFIDVNDYETPEALLEKIIELDTDDEKFMEMLCQPIFIETDYVQKKIAEMELFLNNIFEQPLDKAFRRSRLYIPSGYEKLILQKHQLEVDYFNGKFNSNEWIASAIQRKIRKIPRVIRSKLHL